MSKIIFTLLLFLGSLITDTQCLGQRFFNDEFNRVNGEVGNGWTSQSTQSGHDLMVIDEGVGFFGSESANSGYGGILRKAQSFAPTRIQGTAYGTSSDGLSFNYDHFFQIRQNVGASVGTGYGLSLRRSTSNQQSQIDLWDNGQVVSTWSSSVQFGEVVDLDFTISPNGSIGGTLFANGEDAAFNFEARTIQASGDHHSFFASGDTGTGPVLENYRADYVQDVYLAWGEDLGARVTDTNVFGKKIRRVDFDNTTTARTGFTETFKQEVRQQVQEMFHRSRVFNVRILDSDPGHEYAKKIHFVEKSVNVGGTVVTGINQFNTSSAGTAAIFLDPTRHSSQLFAEVTAHETGHLLGLRHVDPIPEFDPNNASIMDYDSEVTPESQFNSHLSNLFDKDWETTTHNPMYHLLRYVEGRTEDELSRFDAGNWDLERSSELSFNFDTGAALMLHDVEILLRSSDDDVAQRLEFFEQISLADLEQLSFEVPFGLQIQILGSDQENSPTNLLFTTGDPFLSDPFFTYDGNSEVMLFVQKQTGEQSFETLASGTGSFTSVPEPGGALLLVCFTIVSLFSRETRRTRILPSHSRH